MSGLFGTTPFRAASLLTGFDEAKKRTVWEKGEEIPLQDRNVYRRDAFGYIIQFSEHGNRSSAYGWEFDHYPIPKSQGGSDDITNLRPLHWRMNCALSDNGGLGGLLSR